MKCLSAATLTDLPHGIRRPRYDREAMGIGIVHLGIGAFHRAHQAVYTHDILEKSGGNWGIAGVSLRHRDVRDRLRPQNGLYTSVERGAAGETLRVIGAIKEVLVAPEDPRAVLALMAVPTTRIVSMTITEKGYLRNPASGALLREHPDIVHDLANPHAPRTMHGFVVEALARRRAQGVGAFTLLCCDNLPANGASLKNVVLAFARLRDESLCAWIADHATFPSTMVDRIVPATTPQDIETTARVLGLHDDAPVISEPFIQWVVEDNFAAGRPPWEDVGVEMTADVAPFEDMKLRLLNGAHSALAYLGYLGGYEYIHQTMNDRAYAAFVRSMMDEEVTPTLHIPHGTDIESYKDRLIERFHNPALHHRTAQIAMDGSQKLPQRLLGTVRSRIAGEAAYGRVALGIAGWIRYVSGVDENDNPIEIKDPLADDLRAIAMANAGNIARYAHAVLQVRQVFGDDLPKHSGFCAEVTGAVQSLYDFGARTTVAAWGEV